jgi:hypothetical protein
MIGAMCSEKATLSGSSGAAGFGSSARAAVVVPTAHSSAARPGQKSFLIGGLLQKKAKWLYTKGEIAGA